MNDINEKILYEVRSLRTLLYVTVVYQAAFFGLVIKNMGWSIF